jgi:hypothetical protein
MKTGLRVLRAISDRVNPASDDVEELRRLAPEFSDLCIDDLAFEIILRAASRGQIPKLEHRPQAAQRGLVVPGVKAAAFHGGVLPCGPVAPSGT